MEHFPAVCCFGGEPFLDFHTNSSIDPTDWSADLVKDPINTTDLLPSLFSSLTQLGIDITSQCKIFNITFNDLADQTLFDTYKASFMCRCPIGHFGQSCELQETTLPPISLPLVSQDPLSSPPDPMVMLLVIAAVVLALMAVLAMF
ncbi:hypothetical protein GCK72_007588 [Caenorhabditis remanei]|uniref:EGF-like domain-containing protein n=1 Tax=Caenorhabditis remanei TaxID=31234 RepID=A0A6A5HJG6_CAERE|nr:hypothetical protein GCK72_007588 [Caenorhabditis remanei]KAF1767629.1 hypothetical protein GCK72_007588 [Caenorhabditis remanei]